MQKKKFESSILLMRTEIFYKNIFNKIRVFILLIYFVMVSKWIIRGKAKARFQLPLGKTPLVRFVNYRKTNDLTLHLILSILSIRC